MGTFEQFSIDINNEEKRRKLYDATSKDYDFGDFDSFSKQLGYEKQAPAVEPAKPVVGGYVVPTQRFCTQLSKKGHLP